MLTRFLLMWPRWLAFVAEAIAPFLQDRRAVHAYNDAWYPCYSIGNWETLVDSRTRSRVHGCIRKRNCLRLCSKGSESFNCCDVVLIFHACNDCVTNCSAKEVLPTLCNGLMVLRFLLGLCCLKMPLIALWNFAFWLTASLWYAWNSTDCSQVPSNSVFITCEFWSAMVLTLSLRGIRTDMVAGIHRDIEAKAFYNEHSAVDRF